MANHAELLSVNWFSKNVGSSTHGYLFSHWDGEIRPKQKKHNETVIYAAPKYIQTLDENGDMKENVDGGSFVGFRYKSAMPENFSKVRIN